MYVNIFRHKKHSSLHYNIFTKIIFPTLLLQSCLSLSLSSNEFTHLGYDKVLFSVIYPQVFSSAAHLMNNK